MLPGVKQIIVVDDTLVTNRDLSNNFFVTPESIASPRAKITLELLLELNPDVKGRAIVKKAETVCDEDCEEEKQGLFCEASFVIISEKTKVRERGLRIRQSRR